MLRVLPVPKDERFRAMRLPGQSLNLLERFVRFPRVELGVSTLLDLEQADLLDRATHPFYEEAEAELFLAFEGDRLVGRVGALVNHVHNRFEGTNAGFFGFYDAVDDQAVADALLGRAEEWLRARGCDEMFGPASPSHNYYYGARSRADEPAGPDTTSRFLEVDNPDYYNRHFATWGLETARRLFGYDADLDSEPVKQVAERFSRTIAETIAGTGVVIRRLDLDDFDAEITRANEMINRSLAENWGFSPMTRRELAYMGHQLRWLLDPELILFAEMQGEPVGISLAIPDYNQLFAAMGGRLGSWPEALRYGNLPLMRWLWPHGNAWAERSIDTVRVIALGVVPTVWRGSTRVRRELLRLGPALVYETFMNVRRAGYRYLTASWILEDNRAMRAPFQLVGMEPVRVWKIYRKALG